ncbi:hypothetical protein TSAR_012310 [Trichomalopsis sarcophagae]|uniref:UBX domain-containing protein n=1 Tax=Trichomalopsis sarcophagae TaxID=543379 RepID=A0A232ELQ8_9HYME|nr:hypothetical protein TSAR_012310 [Trichomalopsis sarcophagae]
MRQTFARNQLNLNNKQPLTTIQIRLADGSNVRSVGDLRRYITTTRPQYALREFSLQTTTKELAKENKTIEEANILNSAIM